MALILDIADAIVGVLNEREFSADFIAERRYLPIFDLLEMKDLHVTVLMRSMVASASTKDGLADRDIKIDIAIQKKLLKIEEDYEVDDLMGLVDEIFLYLGSVDAFGPAWCRSIENSPAYLSEHLSTLRQFTSVITLSLKMIS